MNSELDDRLHQNNQISVMDTELILSITTIGISALALYISISTAKKQNKIALFEKKIDCYNDLNVYSEGRSIFSTAEVKLLGGEARFNNGYKGHKEHLFSQIRLLFDSRIWKSVEETDDLYGIIHEGNSRVGTYFSLLDEDPNGYEAFDIIKEYILKEKLRTGNFLLLKMKKMNLKVFVLKMQ